MSARLLKSCDTAWVIVNYGIPLVRSVRATRRECIADFKHSQGWDAYEWEDAREAGVFQCIKIRLVPQ